MSEQQLKMPEGATIFDWSQFVLILERASRHGQGPVIAVISCPIAAHILAALRYYESKDEHEALAEKLESAERERDDWKRQYNVAETDRRRELDQVAKYCGLAGELQRRINELEAVGLEMLRALEADRMRKTSYSCAKLTDFGWNDQLESSYDFVVRLEEDAISKGRSILKPAGPTLADRLRERLAEGASTMLKPDEIREVIEIIDGKANGPAKP